MTRPELARELAQCVAREGGCNVTWEQNTQPMTQEELDRISRAIGNVLERAHREVQQGK